MKQWLKIGAVTVGLLGSVALADRGDRYRGGGYGRGYDRGYDRGHDRGARYDRGDRYSHRSHSSFSFGFGFSSGGYRDYSYVNFGYRSGPVYRSHVYVERPVYVPPPVYYYERPVYVPPPVVYTPPPVYVPARVYAPPPVIYSAPPTYAYPSYGRYRVGPSCSYYYGR